jgi:cyclophilin family peptidyl-prolyl cis-trans isomerase/protein-disulfide isomerase
MCKRIYFFIMGLTLIVTSCQSNQGNEAKITPIESLPPTQDSQETPTPNTPIFSKCTVISAEPNAGISEDSYFPAVSKSDWVKGTESARVTIIEYNDFQCPSCRALVPVLAQIFADHPDDVRYVFRHLPLSSIYDNSALAAQAAEAAGIQGKFWEMHDQLYQRQSEWAVLVEETFNEWLIELAIELNLNVDQFQIDLTSDATADQVQKAWNDDGEIQIPGPPFILINGKIYTGPQDYWNLSAVVNLIILGDRQFTTCPPVVIDPLKQYLVTLHTEKGDVLVELYPEIAPITVNSFVFLAQNGWFDGITFHRVIPGFVAQTGDPSGTGIGGPGYAFENEISPNKVFDSAGILGMANSGPDSNGSQFFITLGPAPHLNGSYTIFGRVFSGLDVLENLTPRNPQQRADLPPGDLLLSVSVEER